MKTLRRSLLAVVLFGSIVAWLWLVGLEVGDRLIDPVDGFHGGHVALREQLGIHFAAFLKLSAWNIMISRPARW